MKPDILRNLDRYIGIPLTFFFSVFWCFSFEKLLRLFIRAKLPARVLFIELSEMGSVILADPAIQGVKGKVKEVFFLIFKSNVQSLSILNTIPKENIFTLRDKNLFLFFFDTCLFFFWCRKKRIDSVIDLELFSRFSALLSLFSGASHRLGFGTLHDEGCYRGHIFNQIVRYNSHIHISRNFMNIAQALFQKNLSPYPKIIHKKEEINLQQVISDTKKIERVRQKINECDIDASKNRIVLLNPNASDLLPQRKWPPEYFVEIAQRILTDFEQFSILITGSPDEKDYAEQIANRVNSTKCINFSGKVTFDELISLYQLSSTLISNDSGPPHFASVSGIKIFTLFGPETPMLYGPIGNSENFTIQLACSPCVSAHNHRKTSCNSPKCMENMLPDFIYPRIKVHLQKELSQ